MNDRHSCSPSQLDPREVHLWYSFPDGVAMQALIEHCRPVLSEEESARARRFRFDRDRRWYLAARLLLRTSLSRYAPVPPAEWVFAQNALGKPVIGSPAAQRSLRFNVAHTPGLVACAVALNREVGVDVEDARREVPVLDLARRFFSREEAAAIERLPASRRREGFFEYWTVKEAYLKARGVGLSVALDRFTVRLEGDASAKIVVSPDEPDPAERWQLARFRLPPAFRLAVAAQRDADRDSRIVSRAARPFAPDP